MQLTSPSSRLRRALGLSGILLAVASCGGDGTTSSTAGPTVAAAAVSRQFISARAGGAVTATGTADTSISDYIQPMMPASGGSPSYFTDPYPIHLNSSDPSSPQYFSGTTPSVLTCSNPVHPGCFLPASLTIDYGELKKTADTDKTVITADQNHDIYQDDQGKWHMVLALSLNTQAGDVFHWTVIVHASPVDSPDSGQVPLNWKCDKVLVGDLGTQHPGNYSPKLFKDGPNLYLLYVKTRMESDNTTPVSPKRNDIVAQRMKYPGTVMDGYDPVVLLSPGGSRDGYNSELFDVVNDEKDFRVVEVNNVTKIGNKYAMAYSVGRYDESNYKTAVAWSDTFLPASGSTYRKVTAPDPTGVWNNPGVPEIVYLLQSQKPTWANYIGDKFIAPGVPSIVQSGGQWYLYFGAFDKSDPNLKAIATSSAGSIYHPWLRQPYYIPLNVRVPATKVADATDKDLAGWITFQTQ